MVFRSMMTSSTEEDLNRPPLGFIVEGDSEFQGYYTILATGLGYPTGHLPISNAGGAGAIHKDLEDLLDELCRTRQPRTIIVTVDSRDFRNRESLCDCSALRLHLQGRADLWLQTRLIENRGFLLPRKVQVIIQDPMYECWLIADVEGLTAAVDIVAIDVPPTWLQVDQEVRNPAAWLRQHLKPGLSPKNPLVLKRLAKHLVPDRIAARSKSFDKFWREVRAILVA